MQEKSPKRIVLDTNVLVAALASPRSSSRQFISEVSPVHEICIPVFVLIEVNKTILDVDRFEPLRRTLPVSTSLLAQSTTSVPIAAKSPHAVTGDPDDDYVVDAAVRIGASYIVTRDKRLLAVSGYKDIMVLNEVELLRLFRAGRL